MNNTTTVILANLDANLEGSASKIANALKLREFVFKDQQQANQGYDFWRETSKNGVTFKVRGANWYPEKIQESIAVTLSGNNLGEYVEAMRVAASKNNWALTIR